MHIPDPHQGRWTDGQPHTCHITSDSVLLDGTPVPGAIAPDGISVDGGGYNADGTGYLNTVTITLLVGAVEIDDDVIPNVEVHLPRSKRL